MKVGLALSGGGARAVAHLGVLKALKEYGIKPDIISGVSAGAIVGVLYASESNSDMVLETLLKTNLFRYMRPAWGRYGFLNIEKLKAIYQLYLPVTSFEELKIKLIVSATDIQQGKTFYFSEGNLLQAILATTCIPILFAPVEIDGKFLVDGGIINNLPVEPLISQCDFIIGVHSNPNNRQFNVSSIRKVVERTFHLAVYNNVIERVKYCDIFIEPPALTKYGIFDFHKSDEIFKIGYDYAQKVLDHSHDLLSKYKLE